LAHEIWTQHFTPIIGAAQVDYMLRTFQSEASIRAQIAEGGSYYLVLADGQYEGYTGLIPDKAKTRLMISKLYLRQQTRGCGVGQGIMDFIEHRAREQEFDCLWLTVNRYNAGPIAWYQRQGFAIVDQVKKDIGEGFFMDDFIMEKPLR
jgi:GNAT superfamily N-acetyltransferase